MYEAIEIELLKKRWSKKTLSAKTGIKYSTLLGKFSGKFPFSLDESFRIKKALNSSNSIEKLFKIGSVTTNG